MEKETIIEEIDEMMDTYCTHCLVKQALSKERGKKGAHRFCIEQCTIGEKIQWMGREMMKFQK
ncbi:MAG TPA: zinc-finger domain-containing protein [Sporosarcina sp.]|nr:zinc-finger domain-containing protein [Sporosarcina sp.]